MTHVHESEVEPDGGVRTDEVGVISGRLRVRTTCTDDGALTVLVGYAGSPDEHRLTGGAAHLHDPRDAGAVHDVLVAALGPPRTASDGWRPGDPPPS